MTRSFWPCLLLSAAAGCGPADPRMAVHPVRGQLFVDGKPAAGAVVLFHPATPPPDPRAVPRGKVDDAGSFRLTTYLADDGAPDGAYKVTVFWRKPNPADPKDEEGISLVPASYMRPETTPVTVTVAADTTEIHKIEISKWLLSIHTPRMNR